MDARLALALAIVSEVIGTTALESSRGFTVLGPSLVVTVSYSAAFYLLSLALQEIPMGVAYAIWAGVGVALITLIGWFWLGQRLNPMGLVGLACIVVGVVVLNVSGAVPHGDG